MKSELDAMNRIVENSLTNMATAFASGTIEGGIKKLWGELAQIHEFDLHNNTFKLAYKNGCTIIEIVEDDE